jgi:hypothetical protein
VVPSHFSDADEPEANLTGGRHFRTPNTGWQKEWRDPGSQDALKETAPREATWGGGEQIHSKTTPETSQTFADSRDDVESAIQPPFYTMRACESAIGPAPHIRNR